jgi:hypothetical protein
MLVITRGYKNQWKFPKSSGFPNVHPSHGWLDDHFLMHWNNHGESWGGQIWRPPHMNYVHLPSGYLRWFTYKKWWFSMAMLVITRGCMVGIFESGLCCETKAWLIWKAHCWADEPRIYIYYMCVHEILIQALWEFTNVRLKMQHLHLGLGRWQHGIGDVVFPSCDCNWTIILWLRWLPTGFSCVWSGLKFGPSRDHLLFVVQSPFWVVKSLDVCCAAVPKTDTCFPQQNVGISSNIQHMYHLSPFFWGKLMLQSPVLAGFLLLFSSGCRAGLCRPPSLPPNSKISDLLEKCTKVGTPKWLVGL